MSSAHLGVWLVTLGLITKRQLGLAMSAAGAGEGNFTKVLVQQQLLTAEEIEGAAQLQETLGKVNALQDFPFEIEVLERVSQVHAMRERVLPLRRVGQRLVVAYSRERERADHVARLFDHVGQLTNMTVHGLPFPGAELEAAIARAYEPISSRSLMNMALQKMVPARGGADRQAVEISHGADTKDRPIVELVNQILKQAVESGASDIHFLPSGDRLEVRVRLDGVMHPMKTFPVEMEAPVIGRLKILAQLNVSEHRRPQDGRFSVQLDGVPIDFRVASIATHWGEMMVLRILRSLNIPTGLDGLGFGERDLERWRRIIAAPSGLILVTGPTGSGKTSTLYATLGQFDRSQRNMVTVEDPVEFPISGVGQIPIAHHLGVNFAAALRSILRLDPDIIMVGEIRDRETLQIALEAAETGHLVLSTLHTNDAVSAISRMAEMGAPRHQIASALVGVLAQRLVRRICADCGEFQPMDPASQRFLGIQGDPPPLRVGRGCASCEGIAHKGRTAVYEVLETNDGLAELIGKGASTLELWREARRGGMTTLLEDGKAKVLAGITTVPEVQRVLGVRERG